MEKLRVWSRICHCLSKRVPGDETTGLWIWKLQRKKILCQDPNGGNRREERKLREEAKKDMADSSTNQPQLTMRSKTKI